MPVFVRIPGPLTTVQDRGRQGYAAQGFPECGACDQALYRAANLAAGNLSGEAALEFTGIGPELCFDSPCIAVIAAYGLEPTCGGRPVPVGAPFRIRAGEILRIGEVTQGMRGYLAVHGGFPVPQVAGSRSTDLRCRLGGFGGRRLETGDVLELPPTVTDLVFQALDRAAGRIGNLIPHREREQVCVLRAVPGPQDGILGHAMLRRLYGTELRVSVQSDRMGLRLEGTPLPLKTGTDLISDAVITGNVQITSEGLPVILLCDHQTTGGYVKPLTVIPSDLGKAAQLRPGDRVRIGPCTPRKALSERKREEEAWAHAERILREELQ